MRQPRLIAMATIVERGPIGRSCAADVVPMHRMQRVGPSGAPVVRPQRGVSGTRAETLALLEGGGDAGLLVRLRQIPRRLLRPAPPRPAAGAPQVPAVAPRSARPRQKRLDREVRARDLEWRCEGGRELSIRALVQPRLATRDSEGGWQASTRPPPSGSNAIRLNAANSGVPSPSSRGAMWR